MKNEKKCKEMICIINCYVMLVKVVGDFECPIHIYCQIH